MTAARLSEERRKNMTPLSAVRAILRSGKVAMTPRRKRGRPPGDPLARRIVSVRVPLTAIEREILRDAADAHGAPLTEWIRDTAIAAARTTK